MLVFPPWSLHLLGIMKDVVLMLATCIWGVNCVSCHACFYLYSRIWCHWPNKNAAGQKAAGPHKLQFISSYLISSVLFCVSRPLINLSLCLLLPFASCTWASEELLWLDLGNSLSATPWRSWQRLVWFTSVIPETLSLVFAASLMFVAQPWNLLRRSWCLFSFFLRQIHRTN